MCQGTDSSPARSPASCALSAAFCAFPPPWWLVSVLAAPRKAKQRTRCSPCCQTAPSLQLLGWNWVVPQLGAKLSLSPAAPAAQQAFPTHCCHFSLLPPILVHVSHSIFSCFFNLLRGYTLSPAFSFLLLPLLLLSPPETQFFCK